MTNPRDPEALLSAYLADGMTVLPDRVADAILDEVHRTRQRAAFGPWRTRPRFRPSLAAAAVVAVLVSGALLMTRPGQPAISDPSPALGMSPSPSQPAVTPTPTAEVSQPAVQSLELTWSEVALDGGLGRVAWLGDRFALVDDDSDVVRTSPDGASWQIVQPGEYDPGYLELLRGSFVSWGVDLAGWRNPEDGPDYTNKPPVTARDVLRIVRPPAEPTVTTPWKGRIQSIGIGPAGIVAQVHSHLDWDLWVASKLGDDWVSRYKGVDFKDGILEITMKPGQGRGLKVVWADEGFEPGDYLYTGFGWYSPDGEQWMAIPSFPTGLGDVVGVSDGFIARGDNPEDSCPLPDGCSEMWHSSDGLTWRNLGGPAADSLDRLVVPWMGGALVTDGVRRFDFWTANGHIELPMAAELPAAWTQQASEPPYVSVGAGSLGFVAASMDDPRILFTRDGVAWDIRPMPAEMAADQTRPQAYGDPIVVVGDRSVLVVLWSGTQEAMIPSLWLGTLEP